MNRIRTAVVSILLLCLAACTQGPEGKSRIWTASEIQTLRGKSREDIRQLLGRPTGFYTIEAKGRWHYPDMLVATEPGKTPEKKSVIIYFSEIGDHRCTIVDIVDRWGPSGGPKP
jgi:hypothetical protein